MGFRFRKSFKIAPGVKLNMSKSGFGMSAGVKGARIGVNSKGRGYSSVGIPGTGISHTSYSKKAKTNNVVSKSSGNSGSGKVVLWIIGIIFGIAVPPLGFVMLVGIGIYYYTRNKSPKYQAEKRIKDAEKLIVSGSFEEAEKLLREAIALDVTIPRLNFLMGVVLNNQGKHTEAIAYLEKHLLSAPGDEQVFIAFANCFYETKKYDKVISLIQSASINWEENLKLIQLLGMSFSAKGHHDMAIDVFKKAPLRKRNLDQDLIELHYNLGLTYENADDPKNALKHYKKVYAYDMGYKDVKEKVEKE